MHPLIMSRSCHITQHYLAHHRCHHQHELNENVKGWEPRLWFWKQPTRPHGVFPGTQVFVFLVLNEDSSSSFVIIMKIVSGKSQTEVPPCHPLQFLDSPHTIRDMATQMQPTLLGDTTIQGTFETIDLCKACGWKRDKSGEGKIKG